MARLPIPGADDGNWGQILNDYLMVSHTSGGAIKSDAIGASQIQDNSIGSNQIQSSAITGAELQDGAVTPAKLDATDTPANGEVPSYSNGQFEWVAQSGGGASDATTTTKGIVQLAGDLGGTGTSAAAPTISAGAITDTKVSGSANIAQSKISGLTTDLSNKQPLDSDLTTIAGLSPLDNDILQRKTGGWTNRTPVQLKLDLNLTKGDVGLSNVDDTSDANKPISTATQTALDNKADDTAVVHKAGTETVTGDKDFTGALTIGSVAVATSSDIAGRQPLDVDLTTIAGLTPADDDILQRKAGNWTNRTPAQVKTDLAITKSDVGLANVDNTSDADKPVSTATQTALDGKVAADSTVTSNPAAPLLKHQRQFAVDSANRNIMEFYAGTTPALSGWINEWGGYRGKPYFNWDAVVRMVAHATQSANIIEYQNNARTTTLWGIDKDGYNVMSGVKMAPVLVLATGDPVPANTPVGTVIIRT